MNPIVYLDKKYPNIEWWKGVNITMEIIEKYPDKLYVNHYDL